MRTVLLAFIAIVATCRAGICKNHDYGRLGQFYVVSNSVVSVSNAIVLWSGTLTNGYSLLHDNEARHSYIGLVLRDDPRKLFMLMNEKDSTAPWGMSGCNEQGRTLFYATIIIRIQALGSGTKIAVAVHESKVTNHIGFNIHTGFERGTTTPLAPCSKDERQVLQQIGKFVQHME